MKRKAALILLIALVVLMGFVRDSTFISINEKTGQGLAAADKGLFILKWVLTFAFSFVYLGLTCLLLHVIFGVKKYLWLAVFVYGALFGMAFLVAAAGYLIASFERVYPFTRTLMGIAQSPIVLMVLIPFFYLDKRAIFSKKSKDFFRF